MKAPSPRFAASFATAALTCALAGTVSAEEVRASAELHSCADSPTHVGTATLRQEASEEAVKVVHVFMRVEGLPTGKHAVHLHETASCTPCGAAGGHFDPGPQSNTNPDGNHPFHSGDLINIEVGADGAGTLRTTTSRVSLSPGPLSLFDADGTAFIVHVGADTYCTDGPTKGCAGGARAACGIIKPE